MNFHSPRFAVFLLAVLVLFWALARRRNARTAVLLLASYAFYASWHPRYLVLIVFSTLLDFVCGKVIAGSESARTRKTALVASLAGNLGVMGFFKYWDWGVESLHALGNTLGVEVPLPVLGLVVPVGISFYTFQTLSYTLDIYRRQLHPARNLLDFALFVGFFPQLVAGPIVRAKQFLPQLELVPRFDRERLHAGLYRIATGLVKKVLFADVLGRFLVDPVYADIGSYSAGVHVLAAVGFTFQIYCDFAGYSDIAIGTAKLFGFDLPENFDGPYQSIQMREFWRRWHITLSVWVRDYLYFPLGGSRTTPARVYRNLFIIMLVLGLWHGASWLWLAYGLMNGVVVSLERWAQRRSGIEPGATPLRHGLAWARTFALLVVMLVWVRADTLADVVAMYTSFGATGEVSVYGLWALAGAVVTHYLPKRAEHALRDGLLAAPTPLAGALLGVVIGFVALVAVGDVPYIYFQF